MHIIIVCIRTDFLALQVGFKTASDYETFVWVREKELPEINEVIQVKWKCSVYCHINKFFMNALFINMRACVVADFCG